MNPEFLCMGCMTHKGPADVCPRCGWSEGNAPDSPLQLAPRTVLQRKYVLGRALGQGGFGITYLAWGLDLGEKLAIKEYFPLAISTRAKDRLTVSPISSRTKKDLEYGLKKFAEEGQALARFKDRPGIVCLRDFFFDNGTGYIVMVYLEGQDFKQYLEKSGGKILFDAALKILTPVMNALEEVHAAGMLHRDISPDNIYVEQDGGVRILDFGATRYAMGEQSQSLSVVLKPGYAPEEQYRTRGHQGAWTDIYALGATFYRAITGLLPPESLQRLASDELVPPSRLGVTIPMKSERALLRALAVKAENRFQTVIQFRSEMVAASPPPAIRSPHLSSGFFLVSFAIASVVFLSSKSAVSVQLFSLLAVVVVMEVLFYQMWDSIQDGYARTGPGRAVGLSLVPVVNLYWAFPVMWGFSKDYNGFVDRHKQSAPKLPEKLCLISTLSFAVTWVYLVCDFIVNRSAGAPAKVLVFINALLVLPVVSKICDGVSLLRRSPIPPPRALRLRCVSGEFHGSDLDIQSQAIVMGRNSALANLVLSAQEVSAKHVRVWSDSHNFGVWVEDLNSTNGTFYRDNESAQWLRLQGRRLLRPGSRFRLGLNLAEFEVGTV